MNMTVETRVSTNMRRIRKGDRFIENDQMWECMGRPNLIDGSNEQVRVPLIRVGVGKKMRRYVYNGDHRVKLVK